MVLLEGDLELYFFLLINFLNRIFFLKRISLIVLLSCCILVIWFCCSVDASPSEVHEGALATMAVSRCCVYLLKNELLLMIIKQFPAS
jgi:hypothetical protein